MLDYKKIRLQNEHNANNSQRCLTSNKHGRAYNSDATVFFCFYKINQNET